jgi:hypothetical protein
MNVENELQLQRLVEERDKLQRKIEESPGDTRWEKSDLYSLERRIFRLQDVVNTAKEYALIRSRLAAMEPAVAEVIEILKLSCNRYNDEAYCPGYGICCENDCDTIKAIWKTEVWDHGQDGRGAKMK